ncbi:MAG: hypothetical protein U0R70_03400 [Solirubrobacteraceae bacterium]
MRFPEALRGGDPRSLGRTGEVVAAVLADDRRFGELFACLGDGDAVVRMRAGDALEKVARERPDLFVPCVDRLLGDVAAIDQDSVQWHLAQILAEIPLDPGQRDRAVAILKANLEQAHDWIVLTTTMSALAQFAADDAALRSWLVPVLRSHLASDRKAVAKRAQKVLGQLGA